MATIYPSLIAGDLMNLRKELSTLDPEADGYHIDVMDYHFVKNLTWGPQFVNAIANTTQKPLYVHLMVDDPTDWLGKFSLPFHSTIGIHIESEGEVRKNLLRIKELHASSSLVVNPGTNIDLIFPYLDIVDTVLLMTVQPGFSGQPFIPDVVQKIDPLLGYRQTDGLKFKIGMDGGIGKHNIAGLAERGVDWFAVGSAIFDAPNRVKALRELKELAK